MHISRIEIENIKSHAHAEFLFERGTTAITGANGAGKTTIVEAVAWAMFDLLEYKKDEFLRRGEKKGWVKVTFFSGLDDREYVIYRDTAAGYHVTDTQLNTRIADKKDEVLRFLWLHLRLEPGTDLSSLFREAVGVPQGTFTAVFLSAASHRKGVFDQLLKVEEYRQAAAKLLDTSRLIERRIASAREDIARSEGELARSEAVEGERKAAETELKELSLEIASLEKDAKTRRTIVADLDDLGSTENSRSTLERDRIRLADEIAAIDAAKTELASIGKHIAEQEKLEAHRTALREKAAAISAMRQQIASHDQHILRLRESYRAATEQIRQAESLAAAAVNAPVLEKRETELTHLIAALKARLESDRKFQNEIRNGLCPILSEKCLNLKPGQTLETFVSSRFSELTQEIDAAETEKRTVTTDLRSARDAERQAASLEPLRQRQAELAAEGKHLAADRDKLDADAAGLADVENDIRTADRCLTDLGDPRSRSRVLEASIAREEKLKSEISQAEALLADLDRKRSEIISRLAAKGFGEVYDRETHLAERSSLSSAERRLAEKRATQKAVSRRLEQIVAEIERFAEIRKAAQSALIEKERLEMVGEATAFIRDTLKEAAPRVARSYVNHVSVEANLLFREITGNGERTLRWTEDYAIVLEESGFERPFVSLSGGEQMAAALSVRLALLKQLTDIRIAFFDEPTTNMDADRRENLAIELSRITHFDQLFVISHDETFDNYVDNVILVGD